MVIELSEEQFGLKLYASFRNWTSSQRELFEIANITSDQNCKTRNSITTLLNFFRIPKFSRPDTNSCKCCLPSSCNLICFLKQASNMIGCCCLVKLSHWLGKRYDLKHKMVRFVSKSHRWELVRLQGSPVISKCM